MQVTSVQNPLTTLKEGVGATQRALALQDGPTFGSTPDARVGSLEWLLSALSGNSSWTFPASGFAPKGTLPVRSGNGAVGWRSDQRLLCSRCRLRAEGSYVHPTRLKRRLYGRRGTTRKRRQFLRHLLRRALRSNLNTTKASAYVADCWTGKHHLCPSRLPGCCGRFKEKGFLPASTPSATKKN